MEAQLLAKAETVDDVKDIRDKAEALRVYAKQAGYGLDVQNRVAEMKLRAERKAGELLKDHGFGEHGGDRKSSSMPLLEDLGIERTQSNRWQLEAGLGVAVC